MAGPGYTSGYLGALAQLSGIQAQEQHTQQQAFQLQQQKQAAQEQQQSKVVLSQIFNQRANTDTQLTVAEGNDRLTQQFQQAGRAIMGLDPKQGMQLMEEGDKLQYNGARARIEMARTEKLTGDYLASLASGVQDQESLNRYVAESARAGRMVPTQYQTWDSSTASYLERAVKTSLPVSKQQDLALRTRTIELQAMEAERKKKEGENKAILEATKEARLQQGLKLQQQTAAGKSDSDLKLHGEKDIEGEISILHDMEGGDVFAAAPEGLKRQAAQDIRIRAQKFYADSLLGSMPISKEAALDRARNEVLGEFQKGAEGLVFNDPSTRNRSGGPVTIKDDAGYEALPSGTTFIAPDGKLRRKP